MLSGQTHQGSGLTGSVRNRDQRRERGKTCSKHLDCLGHQPHLSPIAVAPRPFLNIQKVRLLSGGPASGPAKASENVPFLMTSRDIIHFPLPSPPPMPSVEAQKRCVGVQEEGGPLGDTFAIVKGLIWVIRLSPALLKLGRPVFLPVMYHLETPTARISYVLTKKGRKQLVNVSQMAKLLASLSREGHPCRWLIILTFGFSSY